jgi:hypothetical protein
MLEKSGYSAFVADFKSDIYRYQDCSCLLTISGVGRCCCLNSFFSTSYFFAITLLVLLSEFTVECFVEEVKARYNSDITSLRCVDRYHVGVLTLWQFAILTYCYILSCPVDSFPVHQFSGHQFLIPEVLYVDQCCVFGSTRVRNFCQIRKWM